MPSIAELKPDTSLTTNKQGETLFLPGQSPEGKYILSVLVKRTYNIVSGRQCSRAECDTPLIPGDVPWGNPMNSTTKFESDFIPYKLGTDVVLNGNAYAPEGKPIDAFTASIQIGSHLKEIKLTGDRQAHYVQNRAPLFSDPVPFQKIELRYEKAYGGIDVYSDKKTTYPYPRNPLGCGFIVKNTQPNIQGLKLPNIESPEDLLTPERLCLSKYEDWRNQPIPTSFGWLPKNCSPRMDFAGVLPADKATEKKLRKAYAKLLPKEQQEAYINNELPDMDFHFFNGASQGLAMHYLKGNEQITTTNLSPDGKLTFCLPDDNPSIAIDIGNGTQETEVFIHTVMIRMEERQIDIVWRGAIQYPGPDWLTKMPKLEIIVL